MPTLKEIAQHVGVSISTVSRVMNNDSSRHISPDTKLKIRQAAKQLGYEETDSPVSPTAAPRVKPFSSATKQIGCIVSVPQNKYNHPYFSPILEGFEKKLAELGASLAYLQTMDEIHGESAIRQLVEEKNLEGMLIVEGIRPDLYACIKSIVPAVVGIDISDPTVPVISYDRVQAAKSAVRHLIEQGHERIGFIGGAGLTGEMEREKRYRGYRFAMQEAGLDISPDWVINTGWDVNVSYLHVSRMLDQTRDKHPTAMFAASDMMAIAAMRAAAEHGLRIPEDMAFVGLDNIELSQYTSPPLTTIHIPKMEIGIMAAKVLIDQMNGSHPLPFKLLLPFELLIRQSSDHRR